MELTTIARKAGRVAGYATHYGKKYGSKLQESAQQTAEWYAREREQNQQADYQRELRHAVRTYRLAVADGNTGFEAYRITRQRHGTHLADEVLRVIQRERHAECSTPENRILGKMREQW